MCDVRRTVQWLPKPYSIPCSWSLVGLRCSSLLFFLLSSTSMVLSSADGDIQDRCSHALLLLPVLHFVLFAFSFQTMTFRDHRSHTLHLESTALSLNNGLSIHCPVYERLGINTGIKDFYQMKPSQC